MSSTAAYWNERYTHGSSPWDTGITPPEVEAFWEEHQETFTARDIALDLGCGTLTNLQFLARQGVRAYGMDVSMTAIRRGRHKLYRARDRGHVMGVANGDVTRLPFTNGTARYVLDLGCLHTLDVAARPIYVNELHRVTLPGAYLQLFGFLNPSVESDSENERRFFASGEMSSLLDDQFELLSEKVDDEPANGRFGVWRLMRRT